MNTKRTRNTLLGLLFFCLTSPGCSEAKDYDDPAPDVAVSQDPGQNTDPGNPTDPGSSMDSEAPQDLTSPEDLNPLPDVPSPSDPGPEEDTPPAEDLATPDDVPAPSDAEMTLDTETQSAETCLCTFELWATQPIPQSFIWLTGDFLDPTWPASIEEGALEMQLQDNGINAVFRVTHELSHNQTVEYKYLLGWDDNPGPHWCNQTGKLDPSLPNSVLTVDCASDCSVGP